jgi:hypothetical protein
VETLAPIRWLPGQSRADTLRVSLPSSTFGETDFICFNLTSSKDTLKDNSAGNRRCVPLSSRISVLDAYPNPASDQLILTYIAENEESINIKLVNLNGEIQLNYSEVNVSRDINEIAIDVSVLNSGIYLLSVETSRGEHTQKVVIN